MASPPRFQARHSQNVFGPSLISSIAWSYSVVEFASSRAPRPCRNSSWSMIRWFVARTQAGLATTSRFAVTAAEERSKELSKQLPLMSSGRPSGLVGPTLQREMLACENVFRRKVEIHLPGDSAKILLGPKKHAFWHRPERQFSAHLEIFVCSTVQSPVRAVLVRFVVADHTAQHPLLTPGCPTWR